MNTLYYQGCDHDHAETIELAAWDKLFELPTFLKVKELTEKALERIFESRKPDIDPDLFDITYTALETAIDKGFGAVKFGEPNFEFSEQLKDSAALFAARKTKKQAQALADLTVKPNGHVRTWEEFKSLSAPIVGDYNERWLKTEFNTTIRASRSAKDWKRYQETAHIYPNLEYTPSRAATPREKHKGFYGIILPLTHPFWIKHLPPGDWGCLCGVKQSRKEATAPPENYEDETVKGLDNNPGITGKLFADSHPYNEGLTAKEKDETAQKAKEYVAKRSEGRSRKD